MADVRVAAIERSDSFSQERDAYVILRWPFSAHRPSSRSLPAGYRLGAPPLDRRQKARERQLLEESFRAWRNPYTGGLPGFRQDSSVYAFAGDELVAGLYVCDEHEFERNRHWGQLHYFFVDASHRGRGLHSLLVDEAVARAKSWGLEGVYINTDRHGLPETYQRWGAEFWKTIPKANGPTPHVDTQPSNWLVHGIHDRAVWEMIRRYAGGVLVDIGCGKKPYAAMTRGMVERHIGVDFPDTSHGLTDVDVVASAYHTTLADRMADTVLCTTVLEHLEQPQDAIDEMLRILKPGGYVLLSAPLFWHLHEEPRDFFRYTKHGLRHLLETSGFEVVEVNPLSGFIVTFCQEFCYFLEAMPARVPVRLLRIVQHTVQQFAWTCHNRGWDRREAFTWLYTAVGHKPIASEK